MQGMINGKYILLGGNLGNPKVSFTKAIELLQGAGISVSRESSIYKSKAWGNPNQPDFLNQVLEIKTELSPYELLQQCLKIEASLGRVRDEKWGPRLIDIDILYYDQIVIDNLDLQIPHPAIQDRRFTLMPLAEIAASFKHPIMQKSQQWLLANCNDTLFVEREN